MVLFFSEREAHNRTKQALAELRAAQKKALEQQAEAHRLQEEIRLLRSESHHHNGAVGDDATPTN